MAADQERADRIRSLKKEHPEHTWQAIADHVGVSGRAAQAWQESGGITYENAKKLAELWGEDVRYIMQGVRPGTPDLMGSLSGSDQLDRIEARVERMEALLTCLVTALPPARRAQAVSSLRDFMNGALEDLFASDVPAKNT